MTSLLPFSTVFSALGLNIYAQVIASGEPTDKTILSLHSVISDPASTPESVSVAKRLLLRLLQNPKTANQASGCSIPAAALYRAALSPVLAKAIQPGRMRQQSAVPRVTVASTPSNRKGRAISSVASSRGDRSGIRHGAVTSKPEEGELSHSVRL